MNARMRDVGLALSKVFASAKVARGTIFRASSPADRPLRTA
jgi:hypothetical protein